MPEASPLLSALAPPAALLGAAFLATALAARWLVPRLSAWRLIDVPNHRSSHKAPVPRGGGLAPVAVILLFGAALALLTLQGPALLQALLVLAAALGLGLVSLIDDRRSLGVGIRLGSQALAAGAALLALGAGGALAPDHAAWLLALMPVLLVGWLWFINLVNFMDGIDGISGIEMASIGLGSALVILIAGTPEGWLGPEPGACAPGIIIGAGMLLAGAALGFLTVNWHPARVFLGDVGSVPLGFLSGALLLLLALAGHPAAALILPAYYIVDATATLARRIRRRERLTEAHRSHAYQIAARGGLGHAGVCRRLIGLNALLAGLALASAISPLAAWASLAAAYCAGAALFSAFSRA